VCRLYRCVRHTSMHSQVTLEIDREMKAVALKCKDKGTKLSVEDFGERATDSEFLNTCLVTCPMR